MRKELESATINTNWDRTRDQSPLKPNDLWSFFFSLFSFSFSAWRGKCIFCILFRVKLKKKKRVKVSLKNELFFLFTIARVENAIKYNRWPWHDPESSTIFGTKSWFTQTLDAMLPRLLLRLGGKYFSQSLWWKATHCYYYKKRPIRVWRIHRHCLGWEHRLVLSCL